MRKLGFALAGLFLLGAFLPGCGGTGGGAPKAALFTQPEMGQVGSQIVFTDASSDGGSPIVSRSWDFGDGTTSGERFPTKKFNDIGIYDIGLTVTDASGHSDTTHWNFIVYDMGESTIGIDAGASYETTFQVDERSQFIVLKAETYDAALSPVALNAFDATGSPAGSSSTGSTTEKIRITGPPGSSYGTWRLVVKNLGQRDRFHITIALYPTVLENPPCCAP